MAGFHQAILDSSGLGLDLYPKTQDPEIQRNSLSATPCKVKKLRLPNARRAYIEREKITRYLLSSIHPEGIGKAEFFFRFGFSADRPDDLEQSLLAHCLQNEAIEVGRTAHGVKYTLDGELKTPDGRNPFVRTIWQVDSGKDLPRLITAYPLD